MERRSAGRAGYWAAAWAFTFAAVSFYWAAGGDVGLTTLARELRDEARQRHAGFVTLLWATGGLKVLAGAWPVGGRACS